MQYNEFMEIGLGKWILNKIQEIEIQEGHRLTVTEFGRRVGVSQASISSWQHETRLPSREAALRVAKALNDYSILDLLGYTRPLEIQLSTSFPQLDFLPPELSESLRSALLEIENELSTMGVLPGSKDAEEIAMVILSRHGWTRDKV
jgi:transcriptional regulator with XRE-family HTH domain